VNFHEPAQYALNLERHAMSGKWNTGGATPATAPLLATDGGSGRVCDQVCGFVSNSCGDDREYYRFTLPAKKAAVFEIQLVPNTGGSDMRLHIFTAQGGFVGTLVATGSVNQPQILRSRLVNNTDAPQDLDAVPATIFRDVGWNLAVAVEP
jgi:hypothetical protein